LARIHFHRYDIRCAPIIDPAFKGRDSVVGILSLYELMSAIISDKAADDIFRSSNTPDERDRLLSALPHFNYPVIQFLGSSNESRGIWAFNADATLHHVCQTMMEHHIHQFIVFNQNDDDMFIVTLTDLAHYFYEKAETLPVTRRTIQSLNIIDDSIPIGSQQKATVSHRSNSSRLISMTTNETALSGFLRMHHSSTAAGIPHGYEYVSAIPILDSKTHKLVGTLSSSDIRIISRYNFNLLLLPVTQFLERSMELETAAAAAQQRPPTGGHLWARHVRCSWIFFVTCKPVDTIYSVMKNMVEGQVHRAWICNDNGQVIGVFSFSDCIRSLMESHKHMY